MADAGHPPFLGVCHGGPYDGKRMAAYSAVFRLAIRKRSPPAAAPVYHDGAYRFDGGEWHWHDHA